MSGQRFDKPKGGGGGGMNPKLAKIFTQKPEVKPVDASDELSEIDRLLAQAGEISSPESNSPVCETSLIGEKS